MPRIRIKVEEFNSSGLIVDVEDSRRATSIEVALDDDREEGAEHADGLERVRPHDCLDPADGRVEDADDEDDDDSNVERKPGDLLEGEGGGVDDDGHVHRHLDREAAGRQESHRTAKPFNGIFIFL